MSRSNHRVLAVLNVAGMLLGVAVGGCEDPMSPAVVIHVPPQTDAADAADCGGQGLDQAALQDALDQAPVVVVLSEGVYCLDAPLRVHSHTSIRGVGDGRNLGPATRLVQLRPATGVFHLRSVHDVAIRRLQVELHADISAKPEGDTCPTNPQNTSLCVWKRSSAIAAYDTIDVRIVETALRGGRAGIVLLDHPNLESPSGGPDAHMQCVVSITNKARESGSGAQAKFCLGQWRIYDDTCTEGEAIRNRGWRIERNRIEEARDGILIYNLADSIVQHNDVRGSIKYNGIKMGCGPILRNQILANYLHDNGANGLGDGIDLAWGWTDPDPHAPYQRYDDPPDGSFRDNRIEGNLSWSNWGNGFAIKAKAGDLGCPWNDTPYQDDPIYRLGSNAILRNAAWHNGLGGSLVESYSRANVSQLELRCIYPQGNDRMRVEGNLFAATLPPIPSVSPSFTTPLPSPGGHGATLIRVCQADYEQNWHRSSYTFIDGQRTACDLLLLHQNACGSQGVTFDAVYAEMEACPGADALPMSQPPSVMAFHSLLVGVAQTNPYHCGDDDGDGCPNLCEAFLDRDHLLDDGAACSCTSLCPPPPPWPMDPWFRDRPH